MADSIDSIRSEIIDHESNKSFTAQGFMPLFTASSTSKIVVIGQAPGIKAQTSGVPWDDASGLKLMGWLGVSEAQFRNPKLFALIPMDFYYPGKGKSGDLPPRKGFAPMWHERLLKCMPGVELIVLIGAYSQKYYLVGNKHKTLTETVKSYKEFLPKYFPIVHPSPLNFRWFSKNDWFEKEVVSELRLIVTDILTK